MPAPRLGPIQEKWVSALESGEYMQGQEFLCNIYYPDGMDFCCLGVLCELLSDQIEKEVLDNNTVYSLRGSTYSVGYSGDAGLSLLPKGVPELVGLRDDCGSFKHRLIQEGTSSYNNLTELNDDGAWSFVEIAAYIRENPENVFTEAK